MKTQRFFSPPIKGQPVSGESLSSGGRRLSLSGVGRRLSLSGGGRRFRSVVIGVSLLLALGFTPAALGQQELTLTPRTLNSGAQGVEILIESETGDLFSFTSETLPKLEIGGGVQVVQFTIDSPKFARAVVNVPGTLLGSMEASIEVIDLDEPTRNGIAPLAITGPSTQDTVTVSLSDVPVVEIDAGALQDAADITLSGSINGDLTFTLSAGITVSQGAPPKAETFTGGVSLGELSIINGGAAFIVPINNPGGIPAVVQITNLRLDTSAFTASGGTEGELITSLALSTQQSLVSIPVAVTPAGSVKANAQPASQQAAPASTDPAAEAAPSTGTRGGGGSRRPRRPILPTTNPTGAGQGNIGRPATRPGQLVPGQQRPQGPQGVVSNVRRPNRGSRGATPIVRRSRPLVTRRGSAGAGVAGRTSPRPEILRERVERRSRRARPVMHLAAVDAQGRVVPLIGRKPGAAGVQRVWLEITLREDISANRDRFDAQVSVPGRSAPFSTVFQETGTDTGVFRSESILLPGAEGEGGGK